MSDLSRVEQLLRNVLGEDIYKVTPQSRVEAEVTTLLGDNTIWADTGDTTAEYRADTKLYIERLTAPGL